MTDITENTVITAENTIIAVNGTVFSSDGLKTKLPFLSGFGAFISL